jgi:5-formyltetrahydrofolate cyclo-ligase
VLDRDPASLPRDRWGIPVPDPSWAEVEAARAGRILVAAPGLAFDRQGNRLGRGKGYYDRFLIRSRAEARAITVLGVCLSEQIVDTVPHESHDQPLDGLVTERETLLIPPLP